MGFILTIKEMRYILVGLFDDLVGPVYICEKKFFGCAVWINSSMMRKGAMSFRIVKTPIPIGAY